MALEDFFDGLVSSNNGRHLNKQIECNHNNPRIETNKMRIYVNMELGFIG